MVRSLGISPECCDLAFHSACIAAAPPCNQVTGLRLPMCRDNCRLYQQIRNQRLCQSLDTLIALIASDDSEETVIIAELYEHEDCTNLSPFFGNQTTDPNHCTNFFSSTSEGKSCLENN